MRSPSTKERTRVLAFVTSFHSGGTERQFLNLVHGLANDRFEVHLACFHAQGQLRRELGPEGRPSYPLREYRFPSLLSPIALLRMASLTRYLRRHRIEVVHTTGLYPNVFGVLAARLAGTPAIVASVRDMGHMWSGPLKTLQRWCCRLADMVVTNAEAVAQRLEGEGYDRRRISVIRNGLATRPSRPEGVAPLRAELGLPNGCPLIGTVCRVDRVKGLESFLDAALLVLPHHPNARFLIVGGPMVGASEAYLAELEQRVIELGLSGRVILTGHRDDVPHLLPELSVSVLCSHSEGLSNSILESMRAGLPVVATDVGGNPELVEHGVNGFLVSPDDPQSLATAILRLVDDPGLAAAMGKASRAKADSTYSVERMVAETVELYRSLLARRSADRRRDMAEALP